VVTAASIAVVATKVVDSAVAALLLSLLSGLADGMGTSSAPARKVPSQPTADGLPQVTAETAEVPLCDELAAAGECSGFLQACDVVPVEAVSGSRNALWLSLC
jgi:hypothetical protein